MQNKTSKPANLAKLRSLRSIPDGPVRYELRLTDCGNARCRKCRPDSAGPRKPSHGPYWYMICTWPGTKRKKTVYIGSSLDTRRYRTESGGFDAAAYLAAHPDQNPTQQKEKTENEF
jgi:hypothetical protein